MHKARQNEWLKFTSKQTNSHQTKEKRSGGPNSGASTSGMMSHHDSIFRSGDGKVGIQSAPINGGMANGGEF